MKESMIKIGFPLLIIILLLFAIQSVRNDNINRQRDSLWELVGEVCEGSYIKVHELELEGKVEGYFLYCQKEN